MKFSPGDFFSKSEHTHILACFRLYFSANQQSECDATGHPEQQKWFNPLMYNVPKWLGTL